MIKKALLLNFMCVKHAYGEKAARMTWLYVRKELQVCLSYMFHVTSRRVRSVCLHGDNIKERVSDKYTSL